MMFHVELKIKTLLIKGFLVFILGFMFSSCIAPRHTVEIQDYVLVENGKQVLGHQNGLTAFIFENNPRKIPFVQFVNNKYNIESYRDVNYWVAVDNIKFKIFIYEPDELKKYFDMGQFMVTKQENEENIKGSSEPFIGISVISETNEDCLNENSLLHKIAVDYLTKLKDEYNNL